MKVRMDENNTSPRQYFDHDREETPNYYNGLQLDDGKWTRDQTQTLVDTWKKQKSILLNTASSSAEHFKIWKLIASEVNKFHPPKTLQQCKKKFRNIRYICKTAMINNCESSNKKHFPLFYADFVEIISESERIKCGRKSYTPPVEIVQDGISDSSLEYPNNEGEHNQLPYTAMRYDSNEHHLYNTRREQNHDLSPTFVERECSPPRMLNNSIAENVYREEAFDADRNETTDNLNRKHKMTDVSIMGRGYATNKKIKKTNEQLEIYNNSQSAVKREITLPTMASFSQESYIGRNFASAALTSAARRLVTNKNDTTNLLPTSSVQSSKEKTDHLKMNDENKVVNEDSVSERFIAMQERQIQVFSEMLSRHEQFLLRLLEQQREAAIEAQKRDRQFMLNLVEMFVKRT